MLQRNPNWSDTTWKRARMVAAAYADANLPVEGQIIAKQAYEDMQTTGNVYGNYKKIHPFIAERYGLHQKSTVEDLRQQQRAIERGVASLEGITYGLNQIGEIHPDHLQEEVAVWLDGLTAARRVIERMINRLQRSMKTNG